MISLTDVLEYICTGPTLLLYGAGLSNELGLPTWKEFIEKIVIKTAGIEAIKKKKSEIEKLMQINSYPEVLDIIGNAIGERKLYAISSELLKDPGIIGNAYNALSKLPFHGYLTTNYDDIFQRHLINNKKAITTHTNTKSDIEQVDFDSVPTLVKLHSDFSNPESIILTGKQYNKIQFDDSYIYLREFLKSHVLTKRLLIVGYSVSDPDIQLILQEATKIFRRKISIIAIIAEATNRQIKEWSFKYNIKIFTYPNKNGDHSELPQFLQLLSEYSTIEKPKVNSEIELKNAQHLFMWHKLKFSNRTESLDGATDSLVLGMLHENQENGFSIKGLTHNIGKFFITSEDLSLIVNNSLSRLKAIGFAREKNQKVHLLPAGKGEYEKNIGQFVRLCSVFKDQIEIKLKDEIPTLQSDYYKKIPELTLVALIDLFKERAVELFSSFFKERQTGLNMSFGLFKLLSYHGTEIDDFSLRSWFINLCTKILKSPKPHEIELLSYLARAFYCYQALQLDSEAFNYRISQLKERACIIDSNVLLPMILPGHPQNKMFLKTLEKMKSWGLSFYVITDTVFEANQAINWAVDMVNQYGERSKEILFAAQGYGGYRPNQVLDAFIQIAVSKNIPFGKYIFDLFGSSVNATSVKNTIEAAISVECTDKNKLCNFESMSSFRTTVKEEIQNKADDGYGYKSFRRIDTEANVYTIIAKWNEIKNTNIKADRCCFLSLGGFLYHLSNTETVGINQSPIITIDGLNEIIRLVEQPEAATDFSNWIKSSYFAGSSTLLSKKAARKVFSPVILSAEEEYYANYESFQEILDSTLSKNYLEEVPELERPAFVDSLILKRDELLKTHEFADSYYKEKYEITDKKREKLQKTVRYWKAQARQKPKR